MVASRVCPAVISAPSKTCEAPDFPGHRGAHLGVLDAKPRFRDRGSACADLRLGFLGGGDGVVVDLLADRIFREQRLVALDVLAGAGEVGLGGREIRVGGRDLRAVFARVDRIQQLPLIDHRAVGEMLAGQNAVDARADLDLLRAAYLTHQVAVDLGRRRRDDDDLDIDRGRARGRRIATATRGERAGEGKQGECAANGSWRCVATHLAFQPRLAAAPCPTNRPAALAVLPGAAAAESGSPPVYRELSSSRRR